MSSYLNILWCSAKVKVTVWADLAHKLQEELQKANTEQIIIILTSCGITTYQSKYILLT